MRRFRYWAGYVLRFRAQAIVQPLLYSLLYRHSRRASFEGIKIVAPRGGKGEAETRFLRHTVETLRLIQAVDPRRFRRLQREVAIIDDMPSLALGTYSRPGRCCSIDFVRYEAPNSGSRIRNGSTGFTPRRWCTRPRTLRFTRGMSATREKRE